MQISAPTEIYGNMEITLDDNKNVFVFIGPNGNGKSKLMDKIRANLGGDKVKIISENTNTINTISAVDEEETRKNSFNTKDASTVVNLINADQTVKIIIQHWFKHLFGKEIEKRGNQFWVIEKTGEFQLSLDGDGYKSFFNLIYYLVSPDYQYLIFDEPERFLHPNLQLSLFNMIKKLAKDYNKKIFLTTHNYNFIDLHSPEVNVFLLNKPDKKIIDVTQEIGSSPNAQFKTWIHHNKRILFSKRVVLLEGHSDEIILNQLLHRLNHSSFGRNILFLSVGIQKENGGKSRMPEYQGYLNKFLDCYCLYDFDLLLNTSGELGKYINPTKIAEFGTWRSTNKIITKTDLPTYYLNPANDKTEINEILNSLKAQKTLVYKDGEIESYCKKVPSGKKLTDCIYDEVNHINGLDIDALKAEYRSLLDVIDEIDNNTASEFNGYKDIIFRLIGDFYTEAYLPDQYEYAKIPDQIKRHLLKDPDTESDAQFRFQFKFLSEKTFIMAKDANDTSRKNTISETLKV